MSGLAVTAEELDGAQQPAGGVKAGRNHRTRGGATHWPRSQDVQTAYMLCAPGSRKLDVPNSVYAVRLAVKM